MIFWDVALIFVLMVGLLVWLGWHLGGQELNALEAALYPPLAMLGVWTLLMWLVGSLFAFNRAVVVVCWAATLLMAFGVALWRRDESRAPGACARASTCKAALGRLGWVERAGLAYIVAVCGLTFLTALTPPSGGDYDSLVYHLAVPLRYLREGRVLELSYDHHSYFPFAWEMLFGAALSAHSDIIEGAVAAKLWHWLALPMSCAAIIALSIRHAGDNGVRSGLLGAALWASIPVVQNEAVTAYIDNALALLVLTGFGALANALWPQDEMQRLHARRWVMWSAVLAGMGVGCKYLGALYALWLGATLIVAMLWSRRAQGENGARKYLQISSVAVFALIVLMMGGGWYARNWVWTGNPVFPFAYEVFGGRGWSGEMARKYGEDQAIYGFGKGASDWIWLPWRMAMSPFNAAGTPQGQIVGLPFWPFSSQPRLGVPQTGLFETLGLATQTMIGPLLLALGAPLLLQRGKPPLVNWIVASALVFGAFWAATGQYLRYLLPIFALWCVACGWGATLWLQRGAILRWTLASALIFWGVASLWIFGRNNAGVLRVALSTQAPRETLLRTLPPFAAHEWINRNTPRDATFAVLGEPRNFFLDRRYFWADDEHNNWIEYQNPDGSERDFADFNAQWKARGATHLLLNTTPATSGGAFGLTLELSSQVAQNATLLFKANGYRVYRLP